MQSKIEMPLEHKPILTIHPLRTLAAFTVGILTFMMFTALRFVQVIEICRVQGFKKLVNTRKKPGLF